MNETERIICIVKKAKENITQKCSIFNYEVYVKFDSAIFLTYDLYGFDKYEVIVSYRYNCKNLDYIENELDKITNEVIDKSKKYFQNEIKKENCWGGEEDKIVLLLDIMGFKNLVKTNSVDDTYLKLYKIFTCFQKLGDSFPLKDKVWVELFSDTIVVITNDVKESTLFMLNWMVSSIVNMSLKFDILYKGAFAQGKVIVDKKHHICFGQPIIDAYLLEEKQTWFGIACHESVKSITDSDKIETAKFVNEGNGIIESVPCFVYYDVPLKNGMQNLLTYVWFNYLDYDVKKIIDKLEILKKECPEHIKIYYDRTLDFIKYYSGMKKR